MPINIEAIYVAVPTARVKARLPEGAPSFRSYVPNKTYISDGEIEGCGFMVRDDALRFVTRLVDQGFTTCLDHPDGEIVVADMINGLYAPSNWAVFEKVPAADHPGFTYSNIRLKDGKVSAIAFMDAWTPESSINFDYQRGVVPRFKDLELIGHENSHDLFRHKVTGKIFRVGRTSPPTGSPRVRIINPKSQPPSPPTA
ncbi:MAG: hypothetical protein ACO23N_07720 [Opitutales bacterium]